MTKILVVIGCALAIACNPTQGKTPTGGSPPGGNPGTDGSSGGSDGGMTPPSNVCEASTVMAQPEALPADIIWVIDNSGSMSEEESYVQTNLNTFSQQIAASGTNYRVIMITDTSHVAVPPPLGGSAEFLAINQFVDSHDAFDRVISTYPQWQSFLRPNAVKHIIVVTDDESDTSVASFKSQLAALTGPGFPGGFIFHAIVAESLGISLPPGPCFGKAAGVGQKYIDLQTQTMGVFASMCQTNWAPVFTALAQAVQAASALPCNFTIPPPPTGQTLDFGQVNLGYTPAGGTQQFVPNVASPAACGTSPGWYYDNPASPTKIIACPTTCTTLSNDQTGTVSIAYGCATIVQ